jgi:ADP-ribose pyrophosphatase YjhB (NUDIX family)
MPNPQHIVAVSGLFYNEHGQVLLVKTERRGWECPGGQVEEGEDLLDALQRETEEESGCKVIVERLVGVYTNPAPPSKIMFMFVGKHVSGAPSPTEECSETGWFMADQALEMVTFPSNRLKLQDALASSDRPVYRVYTARPYELLKQSEL